MNRKSYRLSGLLVVLGIALGSLPHAGAAERKVVIVHASDLAAWLPAPGGGKDRCLLSTGGTLGTSAEGRRTAGKFPADALAVLGYAAVNLSWTDLAQGAESVKEIAAKGPFLSVNLKDAATGSRLARSHAIVKVGDLRVGIAGVTLEPAAKETGLPASVKVDDPAASLKDVVPVLEKDSDLRILLVYGDVLAASKILKAHPAFQIGLVGGGAASDPGPVKIGSSFLVRSSSGGERFTVNTVKLGDDGKAVLDAGQRMAASDDVPAELEKTYATHGLVASPAAAVGSSAGVKTPAALLPPPFQTDSAVSVVRSAGNRGVSLTVRGYRVAPEYGGLKPAAGGSVLVLDTEWRNIIPLTLIYDRQIPTEYRIPNLGDHLYLVFDGSVVSRILAGAEGRPGLAGVKDFRLEEIGSRIEGNVLFELPPGRIRTLELRFYDYAHGHFSIALAAPPEGTNLEEPKLVGKLQKNEVVEMGAYDLRKAAELDGQKARAGMQFVLADLRGRSLFELQGDATAFDPKAKKGAKMKIGTVADWKDAWKYVQLVVDGEYGYMPLPSSTLPAEPRFLPDIPTGGRVVFLAPAETRSIELRCDFPNAQAPGSEAVLRPKGLTLALEGERPALADRPAIASVNDDNFRFAVTGQAATAEHAGDSAGEGRKFLALDVTVRNAGKSGDFFQPMDQLKYATRAGDQIVMDDLSMKGARPPGKILWIPPGERRSFQAVFRIPADEVKPRLAYAGVSLAKVLDLKPIEAPAVTSKDGASKEVPPVRPAGQGPAVPPPEKVAAGDQEKMTPQEAVEAPEKKAEAPEKVEAPRKKVEPPEKKAETPVAKAEKKTRPTRKTEPQPEAEAPPGPPPEPKGLEGVGLRPEDVNAAIDRGAAFLWKHVKETDLKDPHYPFGHEHEHVLVALALVHSGAAKKFPDFDAALRGLLARFELGSTGTYVAGIVGMDIQSYGDPAYIPTLVRVARYLVEGQGPQGAWDYTPPVPKELLRDPADEHILRVYGGAPLDGSPLVAEEIRRVSDPKKMYDGDNSVSQYAVLGLHAISDYGVRIPAETWKHSLATYEGRQNDDGGWGYTTGGSYGSMTCAGVCSLAICRSELGEKDVGRDPRIRKGLAWLASHFSVTQHPESDPWYFYYMYSLERVGRILDTEFIGEHEWYPLGAKQLLSIQKPDGSWVGKYDEKDPRLATSFALLYLTRATPTLRSEVKRGGEGTLRTGVKSSRVNRFYIILDASGSMIDEMEGRQKFDIARDAVASLLKDMPDASEVALRVYGHNKRATEKGANEDTELEIPLRRLDRAAFTAKLKSIRARGKTPLALSLREATKNLSGTSEENPVIVVLLTDGGEDTFPMQDPAKAAAELGKLKGLTLHVVGFDIGRDDWSLQLQDIATKAKGRYWPARQASSLARELRSAVFGIPERFSVLDGNGLEVAQGTFGESKTLHEGKYRLRTAIGGLSAEEEFWINTGAVTAVTFNADLITAAKVVQGTAPPTPPVEAGKAQPKAEPEMKPPAGTETKSAPRFCTGCGKPLRPDAKFCASCGKKVER